ncbi:dimethyl sulfoxide reductase anchor subunit family protein [Desulfohalovibrio reitneri]|uniref:dimethyl sulfoxide reductase anchor subunit family protein n=1 Tax=Desulfohalovibrio reitneri TaxID=1307759 RepID=UPI0004A7595E|nr:DmsC/YnfH family molybdoenzyme membrane anchor subunit [Desulfohalovibrio reitneri]
MTPSDLPLVFFTVLSQLAIGMVLVSVFRGRTAEGPEAGGRIEWLTAGGLLLAALVASLFHLGHPLGAPNAIKHLGSAWLSREALFFGLLLALIVLTALTGLKSTLARITALVGVIALFVQGMTYSPPSFPALNNGLPFVFFAISAVVLGAGFGSYFAPKSKQGMLTRVLTYGLVLGLVVFLVVPCVWLSGGEIMEMTAMGWLTSPLYWVHIIVGLAIPLAAVLFAGRIQPWVPILLLVGAFCGRLVFYLETVHTAVNMGGMY